MVDDDRDDWDSELGPPGLPGSPDFEIALIIMRIQGYVEYFVNQAKQIGPAVDKLKNDLKSLRDNPFDESDDLDD